MSNSINTLFIVEGNKAEYNLCQSIAVAYGINLSIYCLGTNIYSLYKRMKEYDFNADVKKVLLEIHPEYSELLSRKYAFTYLIFDLDPHHPKKEDDRNLREIVCDNLAKAKEMVSYFTDETDPTIGKLYINYPMIESFRDCDFPFDPSYEKRYIKIDEIIKYKQLVSSRKMAGKHLDSYSKNDFNLLTKMNIYKLSSFWKKGWNGVTYKEYELLSKSIGILEAQKNMIDDNNELAILNTSLFFSIDYFGNKQGFYDSIVNG